jgi:hypothetical protein
MRILYVIFVLCVGALLWAAIAAARHIRRHEAEEGHGSPSKHRSRHEDLPEVSPSKISQNKKILFSANQSEGK